jgi:hypothetical protein
VTNSSVERGPDEERLVDDFELAFARLEWVKASRCLDIPEQATALAWHVAACDEALNAVPPDIQARA